MSLTVAAVLFTRLWLPARLESQLANPSVAESSGFACSRQFKGVYYTHNDSGDSARLFRVRLDGTATAIPITGASAIDWEDMGIRTSGNSTFLYVADVGDNLLIRTNVRVYRFPEPALNATSVTSFETYTLTYPDGRHNCEALIVDPATGDIYLVTKAANQADVYKLVAPTHGGSYTLSKLGTFFPNTGGGDSGRLVTGASVSPNGRYVVVRTYTGALEFKVNGLFSDWWRQNPSAVAMPVTNQGESIAYDARGGYLFTTSEGSPCPVYSQRLIESVGPSP